MSAVFQTRVRTALLNGPLSFRSFRLLVVGQFGSTIGDYCYAVALPWLVLSNHGSPALLGVVLACFGVPRAAATPVGGILADRLPPRVIMLAVDVVRCGLAVAMVILAVNHIASLVALAPLAAVIGVGGGLFLAPSSSIIPHLVKTGQLEAANGLSSAIIQTGSLLGPGLGGLLVGLTGPASAFAVDAASYAVSAVTLALMSVRRISATDQNQPPHVSSTATVSADDTADSGQASSRSIMQLLWHARLLQVLLVMTIVANLSLGGTFEVALPTLAHARFGAAGYGALVACIGAGALVGALTAARSHRMRRPAIVACAAFLIMAVALGVVPFLGGVAGAAAALLAVGGGMGFGNVVMQTLLQRWAPSNLLGRVMSLWMFGGMAAFPVSVALAGVLVRRLGSQLFFPAAGAFLALTILGALTQREIQTLGTEEITADPPQSPSEPSDQGYAIRKTMPQNTDEP